MVARWPQAKINRTTWPDELYSGAIAAKIRVMVKHLRDLHTNRGKLTFHIRDLSSEEIACMDKLVAAVAKALGV